MCINSIKSICKLQLSQKVQHIPLECESSIKIDKYNVLNFTVEVIKLI